MSSDVRIYIKCKGCGEKHRLFSIYHSKGNVKQDYSCDGFISNHLECNSYDFYDIFGESTNKDSGFELIRENDGDL